MAELLQKIKKEFEKVLTNSISCSKVMNINKKKPLRKKSSLLSDIPENSRWWDCCMKQISEWPFEGRLKFLFRTGARRVGLVGNRTRYQSGVYVST